MSGQVAEYLRGLQERVALARQGLTDIADSPSPLAEVPRTDTQQLAESVATQQPTGSSIGLQSVGGVSFKPAGGAVNLAGLNLSPAEAWIIQHESGGSTTARNPQAVISGGKNLGHAFGLGQLVDSNRQSYARQLGIADPNTTDPAQQLAMMRLYVKQRYGNPDNAVAFWRRNGWY
jgi:hypothetical protein